MKLTEYDFQDIYSNTFKENSTEAVPEINNICRTTHQPLIIQTSSPTKRKQIIEIEQNRSLSDSPRTELTNIKQMSQPLKKCRTSSRQKKFTEKGISFFQEISYQDDQRKPVLKNNSANNCKDGEVPESMKICFVKLEPIEKSTHRSNSSTVTENAKSDHTNNETSDKQLNHFSYGDSEEDDYECNVDDPDFCMEEKGEIEDDNISKRKRGRKNKSEKKNGFICEICSSICRTRKLLTTHMQTHTNEKPFKCELCGKSFSQKQTLDIHLKRHKGIKSFECGVCDHRAVCKVDILRHMTKHTGVRNYTCEFCGRLFTTDTSLYSHIKHVHLRSDKAFCNICEFVTHSKDILRRHYLIKHTDNEHFECPVCHEVVKQKGSFMVHMRKHTGERPFHCSMCTKSFKSSSQLAAHRRSHREGEYTCETCDRKFKTKDHLKRHEIIHTKEKPFNCHLCAYACNVKGNLAKHIKTVHHISSFTFKEPYPKAASVDALKRGSKAAEEYLKELTVNAGEILTLEDLQKESTEMKEILQEAKLEELKKKKAKKNGNNTADLSNFEKSTPILIQSDTPGKEFARNLNSKAETDTVVTCSPDILSNAVQLLNAPINEGGNQVSESACNPQYETIPFEIGSNMFIIQVVSNQNSVYLTE